MNKGKIGHSPLSKFYFLLPLIFLLSSCGQDDAKMLYIYNFSESMDMDLIREFEAETGLKVVYDVYESNDILEAKILTGHSGYDVVFPSSYPYLARQVKAGVYTKLDPKKLPNLKLLDPQLVKGLGRIPGANAYAVPYTWSLTVIGYRADLVAKNAPEVPVDSLESLYNKTHLKKLSKCGVGYLEEPIDVLPMVLHYLGYAPHTSATPEIAHGVAHLKAIRPYIQQFSAIQPTEDLISGDTCLVQTWLGFVMEVQDRVKGMKKKPDIRYAIPKEGTSMWLDVMAIPIDAPHKDNAHRFINFLLRPENIARISNKTFYHNSVPSSAPFIDKELREKMVLPKNVRENLFQTPLIEPNHTKKLTRALQSVIAHR